MESYGDNSTNCRTVNINSYIENYLKNFILSGLGAGELLPPAHNEIPLTDYILIAGSRLQE
jgi:hypothetical protein